MRRSGPEGLEGLPDTLLVPAFEDGVLCLDLAKPFENSGQFHRKAVFVLAEGPQQPFAKPLDGLGWEDNRRGDVAVVR